MVKPHKNEYKRVERSRIYQRTPLEVALDEMRISPSRNRALLADEVTFWTRLREIECFGTTVKF